MTTHEVANRLVELCREGKYVEAQEELYADGVTSTEPFGENPVTTGKDKVLEKIKQFNESVQQMHDSVISEPVISSSAFSISWAMDVTMKGKPREKWEEICVYNVKDGKITAERFFM